MAWCIAGIFGAGALVAAPTSAVAGPADEAATIAAMDIAHRRASVPLNPIDPRTGVAVFEVDAEAGLHPTRPRMDDQKAPTDDGHAYWVRGKPSLRAYIVDVGLSEDRRRVWLRVSDGTAAHFYDFTSTHIGRQFAIVLDGRIVGEPAVIQTPISGGRWILSESNPLVAYARCLAFEKVIEGQTGEQSPEASKCQLRFDHGS